MSKQEFLLLIPSIIYGVAIVDLLKIFDHKKSYFEMVGWGIFTMLAVIFAWIEIYNKLEVISESNVSFLLLIGQSIVYSRMANIITPEKRDIQTKQYFFEIRRSYFLTLGVALIVNIALQYIVYDDHTNPFLRPIFLILFLVCGFTDKLWLRTVILLIALIVSLLRVLSDIFVS